MIVVSVTNRPDLTSVHWHGIALRNDMDGNVLAIRTGPGGDFIALALRAGSGHLIPIRTSVFKATTAYICLSSSTQI